MDLPDSFIKNVKVKVKFVVSFYPQFKVMNN